MEKEQDIAICAVEYLGGDNWHRYWFTDGGFVDTDEDLFLKYPWWLDKEKKET